MKDVSILVIVLTLAMVSIAGSAGLVTLIKNQKQSSPEIKVILFIKIGISSRGIELYGH